jgi:hypothetical protein
MHTEEAIRRVLTPLANRNIDADPRTMSLAAVAWKEIGNQLAALVGYSPEVDDYGITLRDARIEIEFSDGGTIRFGVEMFDAT